jgi:isoleucyl-tRNA synthetase
MSPAPFLFPRHPGYNKNLAQTALLLSGYEERMPDAPPDRLQAKPEDQKPATKALKSTLNLPATTFPMKANLPDNEPKRLAAWQQ